MDLTHTKKPLRVLDDFEEGKGVPSFHVCQNRTMVLLSWGSCKDYLI